MPSVSMYIWYWETLIIRPTVRPSRIRLADTTGVTPAASSRGTAMVHTMITGPAPLMPTKIMTVAAVRASAIASGLSPASSAALWIMFSAMPCFSMSLAKMAPKMVTMMVLARRPEPALMTKLQIVCSSSPGVMKGTPAIKATRMPMRGRARIAGSFLVIISATAPNKTTKIKMTCTVCIV